MSRNCLVNPNTMSRNDATKKQRRDLKVVASLRWCLIPFLSKAFIAGICLLFAFQGVRAQISGTFTINSGVATGGNNFQSFTEAVFALSNGVNGAVVFNVAPGSGPYIEQIVINTVNGTSSTQTVTFNCNGTTLSFLSSNSFNRAGVKLDSADYVIFDSLNVAPTGTSDFEYSYGFHLLRDADHNIIRKCTISIPYNGSFPQNNEGIVINGYDELATAQSASGCDSNLITLNTITGGYSGITLSSIPNFGDPVRYMNDNKITFNKISNMIHVGIYLFYGNRTIIEGNDITGGPRSVSCAGMRIYEPNQNTQIKNNRIHNFIVDPSEPFSDLIGIQIGSVGIAGNENLIFNNLIYDFQSPGPQEGIALVYGSSFVNVYHNTISLDDATSASTDFTHGFHIEDAANLKLQNNIVTISRGGTGGRYGIFMESPVPGFSSNRNDVFIQGPGSPAAFGRLDGTTYTTLANWQTGTGYDFASAEINPQYLSLPAGLLVPGNQAIDNMGLYVGVNTDIINQARNNNNPDVGAYEFLTPPCTAPVLAGTTIILPGTTVCANAPVTLNLNGNSFGVGQTYQWQTSATATGTYSNTGSALAFPAHVVNPTTTLFYRAQVSCGTTQVLSNPVQITVNPALPAGTYTINSGQATGGINYNSFAAAVAAMNCGIAGPVVFNVTSGSGPYTEQVIIPQITGSSAVNTITFNGNGATLQFLSTNNDQRAVLKLNGADYITVDSLNIIASGAATGEYGFGVHIINDADFNRILRCTISINATSTATRFAGIVISPGHDNAIGPGEASLCDNNTIRGNKITGGYYGITTFSFPSQAVTLKNSIINNVIKDVYSYGIYITGTDSTLVEDNDISRPARTTSTTFYGIYVDRLSTSLSISKNKIHNIFDANLASTSAANGIYFNSCDATAAAPNIISNNLIYNFNGAGQQNGLYNSGSDYARYYHNTISLDDSTVTTANFARAIYQTTTATGIEYKNNLISIRRRGVNTHHGIYMNTAGTSFIADNNDYYIASATATNFTGRLGSTNYTTLTDWKTGSGKDANAVSINPAYTNPLNGDFTPVGQALDNKGVFVNITTDIKGVTRSTTTPDIGAYEFVFCTSFPVAQIVADSIAVCSGQPVTFTINNPQAGVTYTWYTAATAGTLVNTGNSYTVNNITTPIQYWVEAITAQGCVSISRTRVKAIALLPLAQSPVVTIDSVSADMVRYKWNAVPGATAYQVSRNGINFTNPSSGATGLTHTITNLNPLDTVSLVVKAIGLIECQSTFSTRVPAQTLTSEFFIPNMFTPNGDGKNDRFRLYGNTVRSMKMAIFNQWGEKIFETNNQQGGWDGTYKGRLQPVGVYIYVIGIEFTNGSPQTKKGTLNLLR